MTINNSSPSYLLANSCHIQDPSISFPDSFLWKKTYTFIAINKTITK